MSGILGTPAVTGYSASATSHNVTLPSGITAGEMLCIPFLVNETNRTPQATGWSVASSILAMDLSNRTGILYKEATGSEGASVSVTFAEGGSASIVAMAFRSDYDAADFLNSNAGYYQADATATATPSIAAGALSLASGSGCLVLMGCEANRSVTASDADLDTTIGNTASTNSLHAYLDSEVIGAGNPQYEFTINSSRRMGFAVYELKSAAPAGPSITNVTDPINGTITVTTDLSTTATHIRLTSGSVTVTQVIDSSPVTGTNFTITTLDRTLLPALESNLTVELLNDVTVVASTTSTLITPTGTFADIVASAITNDTQSIFHPNWADGTPVNNDQIQWTTDNSVVIAATGIVSGDGGFTVRHWDSITETWGAWAEYTISNGVIIKVRGMSLIKRKATLPSIITTWG